MLRAAATRLRVAVLSQAQQMAATQGLLEVATSHIPRTAIVDISGAMVLFERFGEVAAYTAAIAEGKAVGSAFTGRDSAMLERMAADASPGARPRASSGPVQT